jgi:hypothetical protein
MGLERLRIRGIEQGVVMSQAKLIKRGTSTEPKSAAQPTKPKPVTQTVGKVVKGWINDRRATSQSEARQAFDALFG